MGISLEFVGEIITPHNEPFPFVKLSFEIQPAGFLDKNIEFPFSFPQAEKSYETYRGQNVRLGYFLRVKVVRKLFPALVVNKEIWVHNYQIEPTVNNEISMEVGIENCIHIKFEYNKSKYASPFLTKLYYFFFLGFL